MPRRPFRIIDWAEQAWLGVDEAENLLLVPDVIARGNNGNARAEEIDRDFPGNASTAGRVFAIHDDEIEPVFFFQLREARNHGAAARFANDIAQEKNR